MNPQLNSQIALQRIDDMQAAAQARRLTREARSPRPGLLERFARRTKTSARPVETAEWWRAAAAAPGRGFPA